MAIYDCFTFYDEFKILELRMNMLDPYVDYFVLSELPVTHRGERKPLLFQENIERFSRFKNKMIYVTSDYAPSYRYDGDWSIENWQRNCIMKGLAHCIPDDIIMISDADEIPNPGIFCDMAKTVVSQELGHYGIKKILHILGNYNRHAFYAGLGKSSLGQILEIMPVSCTQRLFYYYLNCESRKSSWIGTVISKYKNMCIPQKMRNMRCKIPTIPDGGWHFSYIGGVEKVKTKLSSIIDDRPELIKKMKKFSSEEDYIQDCMREGRDIFGRSGPEYQFEFINVNEIGIDNIENKLEDYMDYIL